MPLTEQDWDEIIFVISGALASLDVNIRTLESLQPLSKEDLASRKTMVRDALFQATRRHFIRTLRASHRQKTHQEMDLEWMEKELNQSDDTDDPPAAP